MLTTQQVTHVRVPPHRRCFMAFVVLISALSAVRAGDPPPDKRLPLPDNAARDKALASVRDVFKSELVKPKTPNELTALSEKFAKTAAETKDDPAARFVLWQLAVEQATKAGDVKTAFAALEEVTRNYEVDELSAKSRTFANLVPQFTAKTFHEPLAIASDVVSRAVGADRYDIARAVSEQITALTQKFGDAALKKEYQAQQAEVEWLEKAYAGVPAANKALETDVTDPAANLIVGKYQIEKGNWEAALSYLALSGDPQFKDLAAKDLVQPEEAAAQLALADGWWDLAQLTKEEALKNTILVRAFQWYSKAAPLLSGLTKTKAEKRIGEIAPLLAKGFLATFDKPAKPPAKSDPPSATGVSPNLVAPAAKVPLKIVSARWGDGNKWKDVTERTQETVARGAWIWATKDFLQGDPTPGWKKHLEVIYEKDGNRSTAKINEGGAFKPKDYEGK